ncbi:hypothetical protein J2785_005418 [Burkholderia ambifaria]|nr:hypothetical protein [Burkholderia ambifaria]
MRLGFSLCRGTREEVAGGSRRAALWLAAAAVPDRDLLRGTERDDAVPHCL